MEETMIKATPGPWMAETPAVCGSEGFLGCERTPIYGWAIRPKGTSDTIAVLSAGENSLEEQTANGHLIAAAPDLYAALEAWEKVEKLQTRAALKMWDGVAVDEMQESLREAKRLTHAAIEKARGGIG